MICPTWQHRFWLTTFSESTDLHRTHNRCFRFHRLPSRQQVFEGWLSRRRRRQSADYYDVRLKERWQAQFLKNSYYRIINGNIEMSCTIIDPFNKERQRSCPSRRSSRSALLIRESAQWLGQQYLGNLRNPRSGTHFPARTYDPCFE